MVVLDFLKGFRGVFGVFVLFCFSFQLNKSRFKVNKVLIFRGLESGKEQTFFLSSGSGVLL